MKLGPRTIFAKNKYLKALYRLWRGHMPVYLEYAVDFKPRWDQVRGHAGLDAIISAQAEHYADHLSALRGLLPVVDYINDPKRCALPIDWHNHMIPALDALSLMKAALDAPGIYMEIGSGNSTMFARAALDYHGKATRIISVDPQPRADIDALCDEVIRSPVEQTDLALFDRLQPGDALFIDNSHRAFMNTDVTTCVLDILPRLKKGVRVGFHDIFLPFDYPASWSERAYNEQYLLAAMLLANPDYFTIEMANHWICRHELHHAPLNDVWARLGDKAKNRMGSAFWGVV